MKYLAKQTGFYRGKRIRAGAVFQLQEGDKPGKWMEPVTDKAAVVEEVAGPATFSELNAEDASKKTRREKAAKDLE